MNVLRKTPRVPIISFFFFLNVVTGTELGHTGVGILENLGRGGEDDADEIGALENRTRQAHNGLLSEQLFREDNVVLDILELGNIDRDHDIHSSLGNNDLETGDLGQDISRQFGVGLELNTGLIVEGWVGLVEDIGEGGLDQGVGTEDQLGQAVESLADFGVKDVVAVVDEDPADSPSGDEVLLCKASDGEDGDGGGEGGEGEELVTGEDEVAVDLVSDHGEVVALADGEEIEKVLLSEDGSAGVGGVVHDDGGGALVDQGLELLQVHLPVVLGLILVNSIV